jgi:hypothetical protein
MYLYPKSLLAILLWSTFIMACRSANEQQDDSSITDTTQSPSSEPEKSTEELILEHLPGKTLNLYHLGRNYDQFDDYTIGLNGLYDDNFNATKIRFYESGKVVIAYTSRSGNEKRELEMMFKNKQFCFIDIDGYLSGQKGKEKCFQYTVEDYGLKLIDTDPDILNDEKRFGSFGTAVVGYIFSDVKNLKLEDYQ